MTCLGTTLMAPVPPPGNDVHGAEPGAAAARQGNVRRATCCGIWQRWPLPPTAHRIIVGSPTDIADDLQHWFEDRRRRTASTSSRRDMPAGPVRLCRPRGSRTPTQRTVPDGLRRYYASKTCSALSDLRTSERKTLWATTRLTCWTAWMTRRALPANTTPAAAKPATMGIKVLKVRVFCRTGKSPPLLHVPPGARAPATSMGPTVAGAGMTPRLL